MSTLNGSIVRHRAAALGWDLAALATESGIPQGTLKNTTREHKPDPMRLTRVYALAHALAKKTGEDVRDVVTEILASGEGVPDGPPPQPTQPKAPPRRQDKEKDKKAPRRAHGVAA